MPLLRFPEKGSHTTIIDHKNPNLPLHPHGPPSEKTTARPGRLQQVLMDLIKNVARKSSPGDVTRKIRILAAYDRKNHLLKVSVNDSSGNDDYIQESATVNLGLAICRSVVEHNGSELFAVFEDEKKQYNVGDCCQGEKNAQSITTSLLNKKESPPPVKEQSSFAVNERQS